MIARDRPLSISLTFDLVPVPREKLDVLEGGGGVGADTQTG